MSKKSTDKKSDATELEKQAKEHLDGWKRALADYENLKKDSERQLVEVKQRITESIIHEIVPIIELYNQALTHIPDGHESEEWYIGMTHIARQWEQFLEKLGVSSTDPTGEEFNPALHEAVEKVIDDNKKDNIIISTQRKAYTYNDRVLLPARVVVNSLTSNNT